MYSVPKEIPSVPRSIQLDARILEAALSGLEAQRESISKQIATVQAMLRQPAPTAKKRTMSAATRKRMREAQQRRWAKTRGESAPPATPKATKPKRKLSAAGRRRIIEATKKRWAAVRAAKAKQAEPAARKSAPKKAAKKAPAKAAKKAARRPQKAESAVAQPATEAAAQ